jgi:hypothetical protein
MACICLHPRDEFLTPTLQKAVFIDPSCKICSAFSHLCRRVYPSNRWHKQTPRTRQPRVASPPLPSPPLSSSPLPLTFTLTSHLFFLFPPQSSRSPLFSNIFSASLTVLLLLHPLTLLFHFFSFTPPVLPFFYRDLRTNDIPSYHHITALNIPSELPP